MVERCAEQLGLAITVEARPLGSLEDGRDAMLAFLRADQPPTAVFATTWLHTLGMLAVVNRMEVEERRRFGLVGTGVAEYLDAIAPWLSRVEIPAHQQGHAAINLLFSLIDGAATSTAQEIVLPLRLVESESTARPATRASGLVRPGHNHGAAIRRP